MASAHFRGNIAVNPSNLFVLDCVAVGFFYVFGNPHYFHSLMELGINGEKSMPNLWKQTWSSSLTLPWTLRLVWIGQESKKCVISFVSGHMEVSFICIYACILIFREIKFLILLRWQFYKKQMPLLCPVSKYIVLVIIAVLHAMERQRQVLNTSYTDAQAYHPSVIAQCHLLFVIYYITVSSKIDFNHK